MATRGLDPGPAGHLGPAAPDEIAGPGAGQTAGRAPDETAGPAPERPRPSRPALLTSGLGLRAPGTGSRWRWFFAGIWLIYLIQPVSSLFGHGHSVLWIAGGLTVTLAFAILFVPVLVNMGDQPRRARIGLAALAALAALACVVYGQGWTALWIYVSVAAGMVLTGPPGGPRQARHGVLAVGACYVFFSWLSHDSVEDFLIVLLPVLLVGFSMIGFRMQMQLMHELAQARETVAKLAAADERLRLARDMHDLTGQSLSMITLKAELGAKRLARLEPSPERDAALTELGDIGRVSRQTLQDIREAVSGYRRPTLAVEAITAQNALDAAGIRLDDDPALTLRSGTFDADAEAVLAWCLREAVTNVIRHSGAKNCRIRLIEHPGELSIEVGDDGHGTGRDPTGPDPAGPGAAKGAGLRGMSERLSAIGGRLALGAADPGPHLRPGRGFKLTATVPVGHYDA